MISYSTGKLRKRELVWTNTFSTSETEKNSRSKLVKTSDEFVKSLGHQMIGCFAHFLPFL